MGLDAIRSAWWGGLAAALAGALPGAAAAEPGQGFGFEVVVNLTARAAEALRLDREGVVVSVWYYADGRPGDTRNVNAAGLVDLGSEEHVLDSMAGNVRLSGDGVDTTALGHIGGQVLVNVNVFSARRAGPDNILDCDFFDGFLSPRRRCSGGAAVRPLRRAPAYGSQVLRPSFLRWTAIAEIGDMLPMVELSPVRFANDLHLELRGVVIPPDAAILTPEIANAILTGSFEAEEAGQIRTSCALATGCSRLAPASASSRPCSPASGASPGSSPSRPIPTCSATWRACTPPTGCERCAGQCGSDQRTGRLGYLLPAARLLDGIAGSPVRTPMSARSRCRP